ncbi:hypothetical protein [Nocardioides sp.]|uniref:hypothetical protein n=1 Tax=Nocardioides sp. TaxID=35761 RepID=UPI002CA0714D|nr:hypothetical protein [Nocardioides sp.]HXH77441.1 hypothetical protein [Nocardioides sp.]
MNDEGDIELQLPAIDVLAALEGSEQDPPLAEPKDGEVPPSGVLAPDPTGLGALA